MQPVEITARDIYEAVVKLSERLSVLIEQHRATSEDVSDHERRLRELEKGRWPLPSAALLVSLAALIWSMLGKGG